MSDVQEGDTVIVPTVSIDPLKRVTGRLLYINKKYALVHVPDGQGGASCYPTISMNLSARRRPGEFCAFRLSHRVRGRSHTRKVCSLPRPLDHGEIHQNSLRPRGGEIGMSHGDPCTCLLCQPVPGKRPHPIWGYDLDKVAQTTCLICGKPIGNELYVEEIAWARFGSMSFVHERCDTTGEIARKRDRKIKRDARKGQ